jgi:Alginate export
MLAPLAAAAQSAMPGYSPVFRYEDDFSYLADPAKRTDPLDAIKYVPLPIAPGAFVTFGLDDRERVEASRYALLGFGYRPAQAYDLHRLLLDADVHLGDARVFVQLGSELEAGRRPAPSPLDVDRFDLQQSFADYRLSAGPGSLVLRAGRQEMAFDEGAIIGVRDGPNVRLSFDGVRASYTDAASAIDAFAVRPVNVSPGVFDDGDLTGQSLYGIHATLTPPAMRGFATDAFVYANTMPAVSLYPMTAPERTQTFGIRLRESSGGFDAAIGGIGQTGSYDGRDVLAYAAHANAGYTFQSVPMAPGFTLRGDVLSGSGDPGHGTVHTFNALYRNVAYSTEATIEAPANLIEPALLLFAQPLASVRVQYIVEGLWRYSTADAFYVAPLVPLIPANYSKQRFTGLEQQISATWRLSPHVAITAAFVHFSAGAFVVASGGHDEDFAMTEVNFRF